MTTCPLAPPLASSRRITSAYCSGNTISSACSWVIGFMPLGTSKPWAAEAIGMKAMAPDIAAAAAPGAIAGPTIGIAAIDAKAAEAATPAFFVIIDIAFAAPVALPKIAAINCCSSQLAIICSSA